MGENPKSEARNPKQIQMQEKRKIQRAASVGFIFEAVFLTL